MQRKSFETMNCSVAQCLEVVGEWWSMLIIRDAFLGVRRFDDFQSRLGISRNILNVRLTSLVDAGVLERVPYQERPLRHEYRLTDKGRDLWPVLTTMREWGDKWAAPNGAPLEVVHDACGEVMHLAAHMQRLRRARRSAFSSRPARPGRNTERLRSDRPGCADMSAAHAEQLAAAVRRRERTTPTGRRCAGSPRTRRCSASRRRPGRGDRRIGSREAPGCELVGGDDAEPAGLVVLDGLDDLLAGVHHEGPVVGDRRADRQSAEQQHVERLGLPRRRRPPRHGRRDRTR